MKYTKHKFENVTVSQLNTLIDEHIYGFKALRNREILRKRLCAGMTFEELAEDFDMSVMQIKNIVYKNMEIISKYLRVED